MYNKVNRKKYPIKSKVLVLDKYITMLYAIDIIKQRNGENEMTVQELIDLLEKVEDKTQNVSVGIREYTKPGTQCYCGINAQDYLPSVWITQGVEIPVTLPERMYTVSKNK